MRVRRRLVAFLTAVAGLHETPQVAFVDFRKARRDVVELACAHPSLQPVHQLEEVLERVHDEQQRLVVVDLGSLVDQPFELRRIPLHLVRFDGVLELAIGAEQAAP